MGSSDGLITIVVTTLYTCIDKVITTVFDSRSEENFDKITSLSPLVRIVDDRSRRAAITTEPSVGVPPNDAWVSWELVMQEKGPETPLKKRTSKVGVANNAGGPSLALPWQFPAHRGRAVASLIDH